MSIIRRTLTARADLQAAVIATGIAFQLLGVTDLTEDQLLGVAGALAAWMVAGSRIMLAEDLDSLAGAIDVEVDRRTRAQPPER
jgi:hypothetical protein